MGGLAPGQLPPAEDQRAADILHPAHRGPGEHSSLDVFLSISIYFLYQSEVFSGLLGATSQHLHSHCPVCRRRMALGWADTLTNTYGDQCGE